MKKIIKTFGMLAIVLTVAIGFAGRGIFDNGGNTESAESAEYSGTVNGNFEIR